LSRRCPKQNTVARLSQIKRFSPPRSKFWAAYATALVGHLVLAVASYGEKLAILKISKILDCAYLHHSWQAYICMHKRTAWGCSRIPNAKKLAIIQAKMFKIWAKYTAAFTCK